MFFHSHHPWNILKRNRRLIFLAGGICAFASLLLTMLFPFEYRAEAQVLIISKSRAGVDPYTIAKSAERVGENLAAVMKTDDFFEKVMQTVYPVDPTPFAQVPDRTRRKRWVRAFKARIVYGTGVLNVSAYGKTPESATALASGIVDTLAARGWEYVGGDVTIKVVNQPVATRFPARPNVFMNLFFGFLFGMALMGALAIRRG